METYTLAELTDRAGTVLDALGVRVGNRRVRQRPDARTVRYYTQHGLVDRPLAVGGREAKYGRRHLAQVVAVKRLQAAGVSLAEIQRRLAGAADSEVLAAIGPGAAAALDAVPEPAARAADAAAPAARSAARVAGFWRDHPTDEPVPAAALSHDAARVRTAVVVPLATGVELSVDVAGRTDAAEVDVAALRAAARSLLDQLSRLGMHAYRDEGTPS